MVLRCCIISLLNGLAKRKTLNWFLVWQQERANFPSLDQLPLLSHADGCSRLHTSERHKEGLGNGGEAGKKHLSKGRNRLGHSRTLSRVCPLPSNEHLHIQKKETGVCVSHPCQERRRKPRSQHAIACYGVKSTTVKVQSLNSHGRKTFSKKKKKRKIKTLTTIKRNERKIIASGVCNNSPRPG